MKLFFFIFGFVLLMAVLSNGFIRNNDNTIIDKDLNVTGNGNYYSANLNIKRAGK